MNESPQRDPIFVTQPDLPPFEEFVPLLREIWESRRLTNGGPFHERFENALCEYLGVRHVSLFTNATIALVTALQALKIKGEVITTPYSFVATSHALLWNGIQPVFVDIDPGTLNIDPARIEAAITSRTTAILPVHCYGTPCDIPAIQEIAKARELKVIYDAAHAFGVSDREGSILGRGDLSILSFHGTKVFNTFEGGAIICQDSQMKKRIDQLKNFGFVDEVTVVEPGINGKMSEFNAALGLLQLSHVDGAIAKRGELARRYRQGLSRLKGIRCLESVEGVRNNYSYFPIFVGEEFPVSRDELYSELKRLGIHARRYFYPLISEFPMYMGFPSADAGNLSKASQCAQQVICLPIYPGLQDEIVDQVIVVICECAVWR